MNENFSKSNTASCSSAIIQDIIAARNSGEFSKAAGYFSPEFTFTDHALNLIFNEHSRLLEFFEKTHEFFPDSVILTKNIDCCTQRFVSEWSLTATRTESFFGGRPRSVQIFVEGISVIEIKNDRVFRWTDYYDRLKSRRFNIVEWFSPWIEL